MAPSRCMIDDLPHAPLRAAQQLHYHLDSWSKQVLAEAIAAGATVRWVVVRITVEGLEFLMSAELAHFTRIPGNVIRYPHKSDAVKAMARGYDVMKDEYGSKAAGLWWKGQRIIPVHHTNPELP